MNNPTLHLRAQSQQLGIPEDYLTCAIEIISRNMNMVNAMDHTGEMDDYIYRAILKQAFEKRRMKAEAALNEQNTALQSAAEKDLTALRREELTSDVFYRAVLPLVVKVVQGEPILRLHVEEASRIVLELADIKRKNRATSVTEVIVKKCLPTLEMFS